MMLIARGPISLWLCQDGTSRGAGAARFVSAEGPVKAAGGFLPSFPLSPINMSWICLPS